MLALRKCSSKRFLEKEYARDDDIMGWRWLTTDSYLGNASITFNADQGFLTSAQEIFDKLEDRDLVSWNALISGYSRHGHGHLTLKCFWQMQQENFFPNAITYVSVLKVCGSMKNAVRAKEIHAETLKEGFLENNVIFGTAMVDAYAKCGILAEAQKLFDGLQLRNTVSWNVLLSGYVQHGFSEEAIIYFEQMQMEGLRPNSSTFICILKACGNTREVDKGETIHDAILREGSLEKNSMIGTALVDMYARCGAISKAEETFHLIIFRNLFTWSALIVGYTQQQQSEKALECFNQMQCEGLFPDKVILICILQACGIGASLSKGKTIHVLLLIVGLLGEDVSIATALIDMYAKCGMLQKAQEVFDQLQNRNTICWTALISGYTQHSYGEEALNCFEQMQKQSFSPDVITFICALSACGSIAAVEKGQEIHGDIVKGGLLEEDASVGAALVDMYVKCGVLTEAREAFDNLHIRTVVSWTTLIAGYVQHGCGREALNCFELMQREGHSPNAITYVCIVKACGNIAAIDKGKEIHAEIIREGILVTNILLGNALIDMYAKFGIPKKAQEVFNHIPVRDLISWNALITAYVEHGSAEEALSCFKEMKDQGMAPNVATFLSVLKACGGIGCIDRGEDIRAEIHRAGLLESDSLIGTALVDMYVKCGSLEKAHKVFNKLTVRDIVSWNALITGYAQVGKDESVACLFNKMMQESLEPDLIVFSVGLQACSHSGLLDEGQKIFEMLVEEYGMIPTLEHLTCMIDLFSRAGQFDEAVAIIKKMPNSDYVPAWVTLLSNCYKWKNVALGKLAFEQVVRLDEKHTGAYICMGNIYIAAATQGSAYHFETMWLNTPQSEC